MRDPDKTSILAATLALQPGANNAEIVSAWRTGSDVTLNPSRAENWREMGLKVTPLTDIALQPGIRTAFRAARDAMQLVALGRRARNLATKRCNGIERWNAKAGQRLAEWTEADEAAADRAADRMAKQATEILAPYGATLESVSGDPRGYCLKFKLASGESTGA